MLGLDVFSEGRHFMVMMLQKQRNHQPGHATAGLSGAVDVVVQGGERRKRLTTPSPR